MSKYSSGPAFTAHAPCHPWGTDPSMTNKAQGQPAPTRQTFTFSWINKGNGSGQTGRMRGAITPATAEIAVVQANCVPGEHSIRVGPYELRPAVDFAVGAGDVALAANLAAAIDALPGFNGATDGVDTVTITTTTGHGNDTRMEVLEWGAASAFVLTATDRTGFMDRGAPGAGAPLIA